MTLAIKQYFDKTWVTWPMITESNQGKIKLLLVFLGLCALVINGFFLSQGASREERNRIETARAVVAEKAAQESVAAEALRAKAAQETAENHRKFMAR